MQALLNLLPNFSLWLCGSAVVLIVVGLPMRRHAQQAALRINRENYASVDQTLRAETGASSVQRTEIHIGGNNHAPIRQGIELTQASAAGDGGWSALSRVADVLQVLGFFILILQILKVIA